MKKIFRFLIVFTLFWSAIVLVFDVSCARAAFGQLRSLGFTSVPGTILSSEVTPSRNSEGTTYRAEIRYAYEVAGRRHEGDVVRFGQLGDSNAKWARKTVAENPVGATRPVYCNPAAPEEAVLQRGLDGQNLFMAMFLTPFNAVMIALWVVLARRFRPSPPAGGARLVVGQGVIQVRFATHGPATVALVSLGGAAFILIFVLGFTYGGSPPVSFAVLAWLIILAAGLAGHVWRQRRLADAQPDLVIDSESGTLTVIADHAASAVVPLGKIRGIEVQERVTQSGDGESRSLVPVLLVTDGPGHDLGSWFFPHRAEAFAAWLRATLSLPGRS